MYTLDELLDIAERLEHLEHSAEWIARNTAHTDSSVCQTATLILTLADDVQGRITALVRKLEEISRVDLIN